MFTVRCAPCCDSSRTSLLSATPMLAGQARQYTDEHNPSAGTVTWAYPQRPDSTDLY
ncbi:MAG: hypothetical protein ABSB76_15760 [Streptosporangiaceae bacterium]